ncbi:MAG: hypothetical protein E6J90_23160 [Deltaproteobacteria bacterium]|nr:MAG: hypothetical protein E6J91_26600 [Deltaproteobacteria bacterium]TMQ16841.1 MAG: hypothetical protein E6J90_23160 [Deltaproteobacteria bacterium]
MMWPFDASTESLWLALYLVSFALHAVLVSYVAAGTVYALVAALRRSADPIAERTRDWLPFLLGAGITAGIGPLLFLQLLYQRRFYTANLLMGPRWGAVVPALILGFYALYLAKASEHRRRLALGAGAACFGFVAWSWTELHQVMLDDAGWRAMYAAGERFHLDAAVLPRLAIWAGAMLALFATVAAWPASAAERRRLAALALTGLIICGATSAIALAIRRDFDPAHGWTYLLGIAAIAAALGWGWTAHRPDGPGLSVTTAATTAALLAGAVVREAPRLALIEHGRATAVGSGGLPVFVVTLAVGAAAIAWVVRTVRGAAE